MATTANKLRITAAVAAILLTNPDAPSADDALAHTVASLEDAGVEERDTRAVFGFEEFAVSSGVTVLCDEFYEDDASQFMCG